MKTWSYTIAAYLSTAAMLGGYAMALWARRRKAEGGRHGNDR